MRSPVTNYTKGRFICLIHAEVELLTRVYLEGGGKIEKVPTGKGGLVEMTAQERVRAFSFFGPKFKWSAKRTTRLMSASSTLGALGH